MYWQKRLKSPDKDEALNQKITEIFHEHKGNYGYRRVTKALHNAGIIINKKRVQRIMVKLKLKCLSYTRKSRKYSTYRGKVGTVAKNRIKRRFNTTVPHQKITTDTTEFKYYESDRNGNIHIKKAYLDPFIDLYNSEVIAYRLSQRPSAGAIMQALKETIERTNKCPYRRTFHSDQGWGYQMKAYAKTLEAHQIYQSMSRKGNCIDNSPIENFFGIMKQEMYYGKVYKSFDQLKEAVDEYIDYYNGKRIKQKLNWMSPIQFRKSQALMNHSVSA